MGLGNSEAAVDQGLDRASAPNSLSQYEKGAPFRTEPLRSNSDRKS